MDATPAHGSPKGPRAKTAGKDKDSAPKPARKVLTTSRKKATPPAEILAATPDLPADLNGMIATAAFYLAAERDFVPGHELEDWLEAERRISALYPA